MMLYNKGQCSWLARRSIRARVVELRRIVSSFGARVSGCNAVERTPGRETCGEARTEKPYRANNLH